MNGSNLRRRSGSSAETDPLETRSSKEAAGETAILSLVLILFVGVPAVAKAFSPGGIDEVVRWIVAGGATLSAQLEWAVGVYVTVLLGFYAVVIGGQILEGGAAAVRRRRWLGFVAELIAASAVLLLVCITLYSIQVPRYWAVMVVLVPATGIIFFLAVQLGGFLVADRDVRVANAQRSRESARATLRTLNHGSSRPFVMVWFANAVVLAAVATVTTLLLAVPPVALNTVPLSALALFVVFALIASSILGWNAYALHMVGVEPSRPTKAFVGLISSLLYALIGSVTWQLSTTLPSAGVALIMVAAGSAATSFWPRRASTHWLADWMMREVTARLTARTIVKRYAKATRELERLRPRAPKVSIIEQRTHLMVLRRLFAGLRTD